eukprot:7376038-Prymnesium_polylepis.2
MPWPHVREWYHHTRTRALHVRWRAVSVCPPAPTRRGREDHTAARTFGAAAGGGLRSVWSAAGRRAHR